ncbi:glycosyltransferase involved in cell wall biosynthesis [Pseudomonas duriflava]|uniref:Glycosyltransferase involved in cell wall biosynthesis n=1 Tax=Pseudomonas duriflava TaxID=459528 RepID=A0A562QBU8_9PSED|nr:glycosyltransferase [Pseudomonas duriflava]TWI54204.1 glycosyltransferase involved in cell wall biosynthesis [Pseudomonas duriflava]
MTRSAEPRVLQFCHGYDGPFLDCARQYASLFQGTEYRVTTVFLTGAADADVAAQCASDEVLFLEYSSADVRGLKLKAIQDLREIARSRGFRFCIAHRFKPTYIACLATKLPVIGVSHAYGDYQRFTRRMFAKLFRERLSLLAVSNAVRDELRAVLPEWPHERIETLYNRINVETLRAQQLTRYAAREQLRLPQEAWILGNVGRLHPDKDQSTLLKGFAQALPYFNQDALLVIIGSGRLEQDLKEEARELGIAQQVLFIGQVPNARLYFQAFDTFALSSDHEPFGMVLLEAMAADIPLIATGCGGAREIVEGVGVLFPLGDNQALAEGLISLSQLDKRQRQACSMAMSERLKTLFSYEAAQRQFWSLPQVVKLTRSVE